MTLLIRIASPEDALAIAAVHTQAWHETYTGLIVQDYLDHFITLERNTPRRRETLEKSERGEAHRHYIAFWENQPVGFAACGAWRETPYDGNIKPEGEISAIYLLNSAKRKGIGKALFKTAAEYLCEHGMKNCGVWVLEDNHPARIFYEEMGGKCVLTGTPVTIGNVTYAECAYFYADTRRITAA
ncbi:MAG: GNAT family N-acetyltransferase [Micavibrio sp.]|nr:MAG: GNAT family N-acetyltransferase [Micavibrio sp.]